MTYKNISCSPRLLLRQLTVVLLLLFSFGCEDTNLLILTSAGVDAVNAITLSDEDVRTIAAGAAAVIDGENRLAPPGSIYSRRLQGLVARHQKRDGFDFDYEVYLKDEVNAFAMADGTVRIFSGLMDMMTDEELLFVIGHEMGHVVKRHSRKKVVLAYTAGAVRKGLASQNNQIGQLAASTLGGLAQRLTNAQFSQHEERQADDYGVTFLREEGHTVTAAVSALRKFEELAGRHTFLSSHPDPADRAERLVGKEGEEESFLATLINILKSLVIVIINLVRSLLSWF